MGSRGGVPVIWRLDLRLLFLEEDGWWLGRSRFDMVPVPVAWVVGAHGGRWVQRRLDTGACCFACDPMPFYFFSFFLFFSRCFRRRFSTVTAQEGWLD